MESLADKNVGSRIFYKKKYNFKLGDLPIAEDISERVIYLPFSAALTKKDIKYIANCIIKAVKEFKK